MDLPAEDLQERMRAGKIYPAERAERALEHFFTEPNLNQLREIALEQVAHVLDRRRQERDGDRQANTSERVMVCLSSRSPNALRLLRKGARLADRLGAPWYAVYVQTPGERTERVDAATQRRLADSLALAQQLDGVPLTFKGPDLPSAVAAFVPSTGSRTSSWVGRSGRGTGGGSGRRSSTGSSARCPASTSSSWTQPADPYDYCASPAITPRPRAACAPPARRRGG